MLSTIINKEIREKLQSLSFQLTFLVAAILIFFSIFAGYQVYRSEVDWYESGQSITAEALANKGSYLLLQREGNRVIRAPAKLSIFARGVDSVTGKAALVNENPVVLLIDSRFGQNPIFALFGELDLNFIVTIILSLFAILFSYSTISGERETGTLKQVFSTNLSRARFLFGKSVGGYIILALTYVLPLLLALFLLVMLFGVDFTLPEYASLLLMVLIHLLYLAVFYSIGLLMSALSRHSLISLLLSLFAWVLFVAVIPRAAIELASSISPPPSIETLEEEKASLRLTAFAEKTHRLTELAKEYFKTPLPEIPNEYTKKEQELSKELDKSLSGGTKKLHDEYLRKQNRLITSAETLSRFSPMGSVIITTTRLSDTDVHLVSRLQSAIDLYRGEFVNYTEGKIEENSQPNATLQEVEGVFVMERVDGKYLYDVQVVGPNEPIDISGMPQFNFETNTSDIPVEDVILDIGLLALEAILIYFIAFVRFTRYDIR